MNRIESLQDKTGAMPAAEVFALPDFAICGVMIRDRVPYSVPHSELFARIATREFVVRDPPDRIDLGELDAFDFYVQTVKRIQMKYLIGHKADRAMICRQVDRYLAEYPDSRVSGYLCYVQQTPPVLSGKNELGFDSDVFSSSSGKGRRICL